MSIRCDTHPERVAVQYVAATRTRYCRECMAGRLARLAALTLPAQTTAALSPTTARPINPSVTVQGRNEGKA